MKTQIGWSYFRNDDTVLREGDECYPHSIDWRPVNCMNYGRSVNEFHCMFRRPVCIDQPGPEPERLGKVLFEGVRYLTGTGKWNMTEGSYCFMLHPEPENGSPYPVHVTIREVQS